MFLEDYVRISRQCSQISCIRPDDVVFCPDAHQSSNIRTDDVIYHPNAQLSKHHPSRRQELSVRNFLCVKKLRTAPACIRPNISAARPDATQCSTTYGISFQNTDMRRQLQPFGQCGFPSGRAHP
jgi:hypothetical protein